jgi:hypothetical protein
MPIQMGKKHMTFGMAVAAVKRRKGKKKIANPKAYVATIDRKQRPK